MVHSKTKVQYFTELLVGAIYFLIIAMLFFMEFANDAEVPEHSHEAQWSVVLAGKVDLTIDGVERTYTKGDSVFIPKGAKHSAKVHAGYADISFFIEKDRYKPK